MTVVFTDKKCPDYNCPGRSLSDVHYLDFPDHAFT